MADVCVAENGDYKCKQDESEDPLSEFRCVRPGLRNVGNHQNPLAASAHVSHRLVRPYWMTRGMRSKAARDSNPAKVPAPS